MTVFTIEGDKRKYQYPECNEDVLLGDYLHFIEHIAPQEPGEVAQLRAAYARMHTLEEEIAPWMKKAGLGQDSDRAEIGAALAAWLNSGAATKKARQMLPQLLLEWDKARTDIDETLDAMGDVWFATKMIPFMAATVAHFTRVPLPRILGRDGEAMQVKVLQFLFEKISMATAPRAQYEYKQAYIVQGEAYELPAKHMANATVIEFAEAAQFQANAERLKNGHITSLIDVCAVLLRKPGEAYSDEVYQRNRETFKALTLAQGLEIAFFLMKSSEQYASAFLTSTALLAVRRARALVN
jgi:hypothetical protein